MESFCMGMGWIVIGESGPWNPSLPIPFAPKLKQQNSINTEWVLKCRKEFNEDVQMQNDHIISIKLSKFILSEISGKILIYKFIVDWAKLLQNHYLSVWANFTSTYLCFGHFSFWASLPSSFFPLLSLLSHSTLKLSTPKRLSAGWGLGFLGTWWMDGRIDDEEWSGEWRMVLWSNSLSCPEPDVLPSEVAWKRENVGRNLCSHNFP
jgi:hypothetical protein